jgi:synaptobrevin family protein YKT6
MKLYSLVLLDLSDNIIVSTFNVNTFGWFEQKTVKEFLTFSSKLLGKNRDATNIILNNGWWGWCYPFSDKTVVMISDPEYPERYKRLIIREILNIDYNVTELIMRDFSKNDKLGNIQRQLDETKKTMTVTIESLLERGEKLDDLIEKSSELSLQSKIFYRESKKHNRCCNIM